jgi:hypothetical protein
MVDTNGHVAPEHLITFNGVLVSKVIYPILVATSLDFHRQGHTFSIVLPWGGERPYDIQGEMRSDYLARNYARFNLSRPPSPAPAKPGFSRHGLGLAVDVQTNAPAAKRDAIMAAHGWHLWTPTDYDHFENRQFPALVAPPESAFAALSAQALDNSITQLRPRRNHMTILFIDTSTFDGGGNRTKDSRFAIAGDSPLTPANWQEQTSGAKFKNADDPYLVAGASGLPILGLDSKAFAAMRVAYLTTLSPASSEPSVALPDPAEWGKAAGAAIVAEIQEVSFSASGGFAPKA